MKRWVWQDGNISTNVKGTKTKGFGKTTNNKLTWKHSCGIFREENPSGENEYKMPNKKVGMCRSVSSAYHKLDGASKIERMVVM